MVFQTLSFVASPKAIAQLALRVLRERCNLLELRHCQNREPMATTVSDGPVQLQMHLPNANL